MTEKYPPIPAFGVPLGCLIPKELQGLLVAEKSISVTHIVNGCTRLQPVVMQIGQAAGAAAALCVQTGLQPGELAIRKVQSQLLADGVWLMPFCDLSADDPAFVPMQHMTVGGFITGAGMPSDWENKFYIHPDEPVTEQELLGIVREVTGNKNYEPILGCDQKTCSLGKLVILLWHARQIKTFKDLDGWSGKASEKELIQPALNYFSANQFLPEWFDKDSLVLADPANRKTAIYLIDKLFNPFTRNIG